MKIRSYASYSLINRQKTFIIYIQDKLNIEIVRESTKAIMT